MPSVLLIIVNTLSQFPDFFMIIIVIPTLLHHQLQPPEATIQKKKKNLPSDIYLSVPLEILSEILQGFYRMACMECLRKSLLFFFKFKEKSLEAFQLPKISLKISRRISLNNLSWRI